MNKSSIKKTLSQSVNGADFINRQQIKRCFGCGNGTVEIYTQGIPFIRLNRTKMYAIDDIAERVNEYVESGYAKKIS